MLKQEKLGGIAAISLALIYISAFILYFTVFNFPVSSGPQQKLNYLSDNWLMLSLFNLVAYVLFGIILAYLNLVIHQRLIDGSQQCSKFAALFGAIWVALVIAAGMIANIGLNSVVSLSDTEPELAMAIWKTINIVVEGIGGGNELVGGIWVLALSLAGLKGRKKQPKLFSRNLGYFGIFVGITGISTVYPDELLTEIFGLSQIFWFLWIGFWLINTPDKVHSVANQ